MKDRAAEERGTVVVMGAGGDQWIANSGWTGVAMVGISIGNCCPKWLRIVDGLSCLEFLVAED